MQPKLLTIRADAHYFYCQESISVTMAHRSYGFKSPRSPTATGTVAPENEAASTLFNNFCTANTFQVFYSEVYLTYSIRGFYSLGIILLLQSIVGTFSELCDALEVSPGNCKGLFYKELKSRLTSWKAKSLWTKLDKRSSHREYAKCTAANNCRVSVLYWNLNIYDNVFQNLLGFVAGSNNRRWSLWLAHGYWDRVTRRQSCDRGEARPILSQQRTPPLALPHPWLESFWSQEVLWEVLRGLHRPYQCVTPINLPKLWLFGVT